MSHADDGTLNIEQIAVSIKPTWFEDFKLQQCFAAFWNAQGTGTAGITPANVSNL
jgi:hypothetical protein